jgi:hypothetical protein
MATVTDYQDMQNTVRASVNTMQRRLRMSYDAGQATTNDGTYDRLENLANGADRATFVGAMNTPLTAHVAGAIAAMPEDPRIAAAQVMGGHYGFTETDTVMITDALGDRMGYDSFMKALADNTDHENALRRILGVSTAVLNEVSTADVLAHVGVTAAHPNKVTLQDKAGLLAQFEQHGIVPPNYLAGKAFM